MTDATLKHADVDELLPLLLAGSLTDEESRAVRAHVSTCLACRREQKHLALVSEAMKSHAAVGGTPAADPTRVLERIDDFEERRRHPLARLARFAREQPFAALAAQAALILLAVFLIVSPTEREPGFTTLSQPESLPAGHYLRTVFDPALDDREIAELVASMRLRVVDGPSDRGVYTLAPSGRPDQADYDSLARALRANSDVLFAEMIEIGESE